MSHPNSRLTRFRNWLARRIEVYPGLNEAWCIDCTLNDGKTMVLGATAAYGHADRHGAETPGQTLRIKARNTV